MLNVQSFCNYEFNAIHKSEEELIVEIESSYKKIVPNFNIKNQDLENLEVLLGLLIGCEKLPNDNLIKEKTLEYCAELIRKKVQKIFIFPIDKKKENLLNDILEIDNLIFYTTNYEIGIDADRKSGWFMTLTDDEEFYEEGNLLFEDNLLYDYNGTYSLDYEIIDCLKNNGFNMDTFIDERIK